MKFLKIFFSKTNLIIYSIIIGLIGIDLLTKYLIQSNLELFESVPILNGVLNFKYILNKGGAWGIFSESNATIWLGILSLIFAIAMLIINAFYVKNKNTLYHISFALIIAGTIGNMIDRFFVGAVRDFISLDFITFPIFNVADIFLVVGVIMFCLWYLLILLKDKNDDEKTKNKENQIANKDANDLEN